MSRGALVAALGAGLLLGLAACGGVEDPPAPAGPAPQAADEGSAVARRLADRVLALEAELETERAARAALQRDVEELRLELARCEEYRVRREEEWLGYTRLVATLDPASIPPDVRFRSELEDPGPDPADAEAAAREAAREARRLAVQRSLASLLVLEGVNSLDLLELAGVHDGWAGPVVFRQLDHRGRLAGSLYAERLRLEGSRSSRTLTIVLENGHESHGGVRTPFASLRSVAPAPPAEPAPSADDPASDPGSLPAHAGPPAPAAPAASVADGPDESPASDGEADGAESDLVNRRRILLPDVDPQPWYESLPELFDASPLDLAVDDGLWNLPVLRHSLNTLLRRDAAEGYYQVVAIAGVVDEVLRNVQLEQHDERGAPVRRLFADFVRCLPAERGVVLELRDGAVVRGGRKAPFLDGMLRIYLPRAEPDDWAEAGVPGFSAPPADVPRRAPAEGAGPR